MHDNIMTFDLKVSHNATNVLLEHSKKRHITQTKNKGGVIKSCEKLPRALTFFFSVAIFEGRTVRLRLRQKQRQR